MGSGIVLLPTKGQIVCWGDGTQPPAGHNFVKVAPGGAGQGLAIREDGGLTLWGTGSITVSHAPGEKFDDIAIGPAHAVAIRSSDGTIAPFGNFALGGSAAPPPEFSGHRFTAITVGGGFCLGIANFRLYQWGAGKGSEPDGIYVAVAARSDYALALREDGAIVGWGGKVFPKPGPPPWVPTLPGWNVEGGHYVHPGPFIAIAAGYPQNSLANPKPHILALKPDGTVVGWGPNTYGENTPPAGVKFKAIAAGLGYSLGLDQSGYIHHWGDEDLLPLAPAGQVSAQVPTRRLARVPSGRFMSIGASTRYASAVAAANNPSSAAEP